MNKFYNEICKYYEDIFQKNEAQLNFLNSISEGKDYLDIGCATGLVAKNLEELGKNVTCIDLEESMVNEARKKGLKVYEKNMLELDFEEKFDVCYCIGTTIAHLEDINQICSFILKTLELLKEDGKLVLSWVNFKPFILTHDLFLGALPTLGTKVKFTRNYYRENSKIRFNTVLTTENESFENTQLLVPLLVDDIISFVNRLGLKYEIYGNFKKEEFDEENSLSVVFVISK